ncbi:hypothetical protein M422DRAFT_249969 [Sphaerobolus stellatus SS14]|nr:hypothetical protein M422DRAFT_249969 [Sphaerobolus stellatus SS14]
MRLPSKAFAVDTKSISATNLDFLSKNFDFNKIILVTLAESDDEFKSRSSWSWLKVSGGLESTHGSARPFEMVIKVENGLKGIARLEHITSTCTILNELHIYGLTYRKDGKGKILEIPEMDWPSDIFDYVQHATHFSFMEEFSYSNVIIEPHSVVIAEAIPRFAAERKGKLKAITLRNCGPPLALELIESLKRMDIAYSSCS